MAAVASFPTMNGSSTNGSFSYSSSMSSSSQLNIQKVTVLREITSKVTASSRRELGSSSAALLEDVTEVGVVLDYIAAERLRCMPHSGSRYDKVLRWAESFAAQIHSFSHSVSEFVMYSTEGAQLIWGSCLMLLQLGESHVELLEKLFGIFYKFGLSVEIFTRHKKLLLQSPAAQKSCAKAFASLLQVTANATTYYCKKAKNGTSRTKSGEFEELFGRIVEAFYHETSASSIAMWSVSIEGLISSEQVDDVETVRRYLAPQDRITQALMSDRISSRHLRAEYTCEWAGERLTDFARSKDHVLLITGKEHSGKSVLAGWIADRMRNTKGRLAHEVISFSIDAALKDQMTQLAVLQGLVLQVFDRNVGDLSLFKAIVSAQRASKAGRPTSEVEDALWGALDAGLLGSGKLVIVIDGIDQFGESTSLQFLERLQNICSKHEPIKAVALSRPLTKTTPKNIKLWSVEPEHIQEDITHFVHERLASAPSLKSLHHDQKHTIAHKIATSANGSFTWADIAIEIIKTEKTVAGITKILDSLPKALKEVINRLIATVDLTTRDSRSILAWMLAAQRPLLLSEIKQLFEIDFTTMTYSQRFTDIESDVRHACGGLVDISDGILRFRSLAIRHHLNDLAGSVTDFSNSKDAKFPFHTQEANYDLCLRTLAYVKIVLDRQFHISTTFLTYNQLVELFNEYAFLEYASRYWLTHFRNSPMYEPTGKHKLTGGFKTSFPNSVAHALIEVTCIRLQYPLTEVYELLQLSLDLRRTVLGDSNEVVLQSLINVATVRQHLTIKETNNYFYQAWKLSQNILSYDSEVTITCAQSFIDSITTFTTRSTEVEEVLQYIVDIRKQTYGVSHTLTISYSRRLAEYYTAIKEETKAAIIYREIYEIMVSRYGHSHTETEETYRSLKAVSKQEDIQKITQEQHTSIEKNVSVLDARRVTVTQEMVQQYEKEQNYVKAEETIVNYWREISEVSRTTTDIKVREQQVDATFQYVEFLRRQKRTEEATSILNGLYFELEKNTTFAQSKVGWIERIGSQMKDLGATSLARSVYSSLWSYYRSRGQQNTKEAQSVAHSLTETATSSVTTSTTTESQEDILREIFEATTMTSTTTVNTTMVKTCQQLITVYSRQEKREAIVEVCRDILQRMWPTVLTGQKDVKLPTQFISESLEIANQLARSYFIQHYVDEASQIYYSVFQGFRSSPKQYTNELLTSARTLITHYQNIYRHTNALAIYQALYEALVEAYGVSDQRTIDIAYEKADLELRQNRRREAQASYEKIYTSLKGNSEFCHKEGIRAALSLCKMYEKEQKWEQARTIYQVLWQTFLKKGQEYDLGVEFVDQIFDQYLYIIENKARADSKTLRGFAAEYRDTCIKFYGAESERTLTASMRLAELDEKDEKYKEEAISIYEFVLDTHQRSKKISTAATFATIATSKQRLAHLYSARGVTHDRAQNLYLEEYESAKTKHSYSHNDTVSWLNLLVTCYKKRNTPESNMAASTTLQDISTNILLHEKDSQKLYESAQAIAKIYLSQNVTEPSASDFLIELRRHVISGESSIAHLKGKTTDRRAFVFIVGFEETVRGLEGAGQFSVLMSELMSESLLAEAYLKARKGNAPFDTVFGYGTRLRSFLRSKQRKEATRVDEELLEMFTHKIVANRQVDKAAIRQFFDIVIAEFGKDQQDVTVLKRVAEAVLRSFNENQFQRGYSLAVLVDAYMHHYDGFRSQIKIETAFKICLYLTGHGTKKCTDAILTEKMTHLSRVLLKEVLHAAKAIRLSLTALSVEELNSLVGLLGEQQNYDDLEVGPEYPYASSKRLITNASLYQWILHDLWTSRHTQSSWPPSTIVTIGRKLIECRFSMGDRYAALHLAEDICYNLRRVWGPLDKTTLEMSSLLAEMYTAVGQHAKAMAVHEEILNQITSDEIDLDQVTSEEEASIATRHLDLLKHSHARNGGFPTDKDATSYTELYRALESQVGSQQAWKAGVSSGAVLGPEKWSVKNFKDTGLGQWAKPVSFEFMSEQEKKRKHVNAMRRTSGRYASGDFGKEFENGVAGVNGSVGARVNGNAQAV